MLHQVLGRSCKQDQQLGDKKAQQKYQLNNSGLKSYSAFIVLNHSKTLCEIKLLRATQLKYRKNILPKETLINREVFWYLKY